MGPRRWRGSPLVRDPRADTWAPLNWGRHCQPPVLPSCASSGEHTHTLTHTHTHTHSYTLTRTPLSFLFPDVLGFHIYGGKTFLIELPFPEGLWNPTPKLISAARSTKSGSVLICGAHSPRRRRAWAGARRRARAAGCSAHLRTCAPGPTRYRSASRLLGSARGVRARRRLPRLAFPGLCCCRCRC